jgi:hypothetical protein
MPGRRRLLLGQHPWLAAWRVALAGRLLGPWRAARWFKRKKSVNVHSIKYKKSVNLSVVKYKKSVNLT